MKEKYVLFGAGRIGKGVLNYFGKENFVAVIDNSKNKQGTFFEGVPIISFSDFLEKDKNTQVIISIYTYRYFECIRQLQEAGVYNYFTAPPVVYGCPMPEKLAEELYEHCEKAIVFYTKNPISLKMAEWLEGRGVSYIWKEEKSLLLVGEQKNEVLVLTTNEDEDAVREYIKGKYEGEVFDIYQKWMRDYLSLKKYSNIHAGKRCFVIGNGPSLMREDLDKIRESGDITFGANGIYHIYSQTNWRPTYYTVVDQIGIEMFAEEIKRKNNDIVKFVADFYYIPQTKEEHIEYIPIKNEICKGKYMNFADDITKGLYSGRTVTYTSLQLACYMGIKEIYLLGVDFTGNGMARYDFYNQTEEEKDVEEYKDIWDEEKAYYSAKRYAEQNGIKIYNATRGGELYIFERVNFDSLFE